MHYWLIIQECSSAKQTKTKDYDIIKIQQTHGCGASLQWCSSRFLDPYWGILWRFVPMHASLWAISLRLTTLVKLITPACHTNRDCSPIDLSDVSAPIFTSQFSGCAAPGVMVIFFFQVLSNLTTPPCLHESYPPYWSLYGPYKYIEQKLEQFVIRLW